MKKALNILSVALTAYLLYLPLFGWIFSIFDYSFALPSYTAYAAVGAVLAAAALVITLLSTKERPSTLARILFIVSPILSFISAVKCGALLCDAEILIPSLICFLIAAALAFINAVRISLKIVSCGVVAALLALGIIAAPFMTLISSSTDTLSSVDSPNGEYYAEIISEDHGAKGGKTLVMVYEKRGCDLGIFKLSPTDGKCIYSGEWEEAFKMEISWRDNGILLINSTEYVIE